MTGRRRARGLHVREALLRQLVDRLVDRLTVPPAGTPTLPWVPAEVASVTPGGAADGNAAITVLWKGDEYPAAYLSSYTPAVGHQVACAYNGAQLLVLGPSIGTPPEV